MSLSVVTISFWMLAILIESFSCRKFMSFSELPCLLSRLCDFVKVHVITVHFLGQVAGALDIRL